MNRLSPRLMMALALVGAAALAQVAVLVAMVSLDTALRSGASAGPLFRIQSGTNLLDAGILMLVPLAVVLARWQEPDSPWPDAAARRSIYVGGAAVGATATFLLALRLLADLVGDAQLQSQAGAGDLVYDLALLLVAVASSLWAYAEFRQGSPDSGSEDPERGASTTRPPEPPPNPAGTGFPSGPPTAPPASPPPG